MVCVADHKLMRSLFAAISLCFLLAAPPRAGARQNFQRQQQRPARQAQHQAKPKAGEWLRKYKDMPPAEQEKALASDPQFQRLPAERQQKLRERLHEFNNMPAQRKQRVINRMEAFDQLTPQQRQQARDLNGRLKDVAPERRQQMRVALRNLRGMDPGQRDQVMNSPQFRSRFNDNERDILHGLLQLPIGPGAQSGNGGDLN